MKYDGKGKWTVSEGEVATSFPGRVQTIKVHVLVTHEGMFKFSIERNGPLSCEGEIVYPFVHSTHEQAKEAGLEEARALIRRWTRIESERIRSGAGR